jgi:hypothetical protein
VAHIFLKPNLLPVWKHPELMHPAYLPGQLSPPPELVHVSLHCAQKEALVAALTLGLATAGVTSNATAATETNILSIWYISLLMNDEGD